MDNAAQDRLVKILLNSEKFVAKLMVNQKTYKREPWSELYQQMQFFLEGSTNQWLSVAGLRGVGKTTLLLQLFNDPSLNQSNVKKFYFDIDKLSLAPDAIHDLADAVYALHDRYPNDKILLFMDEVHRHAHWSLGCKRMFDEIPQIFIVCTGSSALQLQLNPDSGRRIMRYEMYPLSLPDFLALRQFDMGIEPVAPASDLKQNLQKALLESKTKQEVHRGLLDCADQVDNYYQQFNQTLLQNDDFLMHQSFMTHCFEEYINNYGTFPIIHAQPQARTADRLFNVTDEEKQYINQQQEDRLQEMIKTTVQKDMLEVMPHVYKHTQIVKDLRVSTLRLAPQLIELLAKSEQITLQKLAKNLENIHQQTLRSMLEFLIISGLLIEIPPLGASANRKNTKTPKYRFGSPAIRQSQVPLNPLEATDQTAQLRGNLLEDTVAMYLHRILEQLPGHKVVEYDSQVAGADFVISSRVGAKKGIVIEVGYTKKTARQVKRTLRKEDLYGLVITNTDEPRLATENNAVYVPLKYFLLS